MYEKDQKIIDMTVEEFKKYNMPEGWKMAYLSGEEKRGWPGSLDDVFMVHVVLERIVK
jgi:hypothetical protein